MKKSRIYQLLFVCLSVIICPSCDNHLPIDNSIHVGDVLCDDHGIMHLDDYLQQSNRKAVGVVFATSTAIHPVLAVSLKDSPKVQYADTLSYIQNTSADIAAFDGFSNTVALQGSYSEKTGHGSPMANLAFRSHIFGQSDFVASVAELRMLVQNLTLVNEVIAKVGGQVISTQSQDGSCWYWTSTEVAANRGNQAWLMSMTNGAIQETPKDAWRKVRMIISVNY